MFITEAQFRRKEGDDHDCWSWRAVHRMMVLPWIVAQVVSDDDMAVVSDVMIESVQTLLELVQNRQLGNVLDVHVVTPADYVSDLPMAIERVERLEATIPDPGSTQRVAVLTCINGRRYYCNWLQVEDQDEVAPLELVKRFPDLEALDGLYGPAGDDSFFRRA
jgi:hypothetical protein